MLSFFRNAAICQGVYKRSLQGNAVSANAITDDVAEYMADTGASIMDGSFAAESAISSAAASGSPGISAAPVSGGESHATGVGVLGLEMSPKVRGLYDRVLQFMNDEVRTQLALLPLPRVTPSALLRLTSSRSCR